MRFVWNRKWKGIKLLAVLLCVLLLVCCKPTAPPPLEPVCRAAQGLYAGLDSWYQGFYDGSERLVRQFSRGTRWLCDGLARLLCGHPCESAARRGNSPLQARVGCAIILVNGNGAVRIAKLCGRRFLFGRCLV